MDVSIIIPTYNNASMLATTLSAFERVDFPEGTELVVVDNNSTDNCGIDTIFLDQNTFTCADIGLNAVEMTVRDESGNENFCTTNIDVQDKVDPKAVCMDGTSVL